MAASQNRSYGNSSIMRPPRNTSSVAVAVTSNNLSNDPRWPESSPPKTSVFQPRYQKNSKAPPPPPTQHMPRQYASHFPSLPDSAPAAMVTSQSPILNHLNEPVATQNEKMENNYQMNRNNFHENQQSVVNATNKFHHEPEINQKEKYTSSKATKNLGTVTQSDICHQNSDQTTAQIKSKDYIDENVIDSPKEHNHLTLHALQSKNTHNKSNSNYKHYNTAANKTRNFEHNSNRPQTYKNNNNKIHDYSTRKKHTYLQEQNNEPSDNTPNIPASDASISEEDSNNNSSSNNKSNYNSHITNNTLGSHAFRVRAIISGWKAGTIIGRRGAVINSLRQASNCRIVMSDDPTSADRTLSISGLPLNVANVLEKVCFLLSLNPRYKSFETTDITEDVKSGNQFTSINFTLAVPSPLCGCLIGRKGAQIRDFRQRHGVVFLVSPSTIADSMDRPVTISGHPQNVADCLREVCKFLSQTEETSAPTGGMFRDMWKQTVTKAVGVHIHADEQPHYLLSDVKQPRKNTQVNAKNNRRAYSIEQIHVEDNDEVLGNSIRECSFELANGDTEVHLLVPNDIVGCIIGRGGKTISEIRETSGAFISITDGLFPPQPPSNAINIFAPTNSSHRPANNTSRGTRRDRVIVIRGLSKSVQTARYLMGSSILNAQRGGTSLLAPAADLNT